MFAKTFRKSLAGRVGSFVEIATDNNLVTGILAAVSGDLVLVLQSSTGYNNAAGNKVWIVIDKINFVRFESDAA